MRNRGIGLRSLKEAIDTDSSTGQVVFHIFGALAEFERALIRERTQAGLAAARARGRLGGRRKRLDEPQRQHAVELYRSREHTVKDVERMGHPPSSGEWWREWGTHPRREGQWKVNSTYVGSGD